MTAALTAPLATILIVEDDPEISRLVADFMRREGFEVACAVDGRAMDAVLARLRPDILILDLMLPGEDGLSICRRLRADDNIPILMLTAKSDEIDRVVGLEMGADDYLTKPFAPRELLARVRAILRRVKAAPAKLPVRRYAFDRFVIDLDSRSIQFGDASDDSLQLTSAEFDLLLGCAKVEGGERKLGRLKARVHGQRHCGRQLAVVEHRLLRVERWVYDMEFVPARRFHAIPEATAVLEPVDVDRVAEDSLVEVPGEELFRSGVVWRCRLCCRHVDHDGREHEDDGHQPEQGNENGAHKTGLRGVGGEERYKCVGGAGKNSVERSAASECRR